MGHLEKPPLWFCWLKNCPFDDCCWFEDVELLRPLAAIRESVDQISSKDLLSFSGLFSTTMPLGWLLLVLPLPELLKESNVPVGK